MSQKICNTSVTAQFGPGPERRRRAVLLVIAGLCFLAMVAIVVWWVP